MGAIFLDLCLSKLGKGLPHTKFQALKPSSSDEKIEYFNGFLCFEPRTLCRRGNWVILKDCVY